MNRKRKIASIAIFIIMALTVGYLTLFMENAPVQREIKGVKIEGALYLTSEQYMKFANLDNPREYKGLNLSVIKDRLQKHPYVKSADVKFIEKNKVVAVLHEKRGEAIILGKSGAFLLTSDFEALPMLPYAKNIDYPVIVNYKNFEKIRKFDKIKDNDLIGAFKIINSVKMADVRNKFTLSEINLNRNGEPALFFSDFDFPILIGRYGEAKKICALIALLKDINKYNDASEKIKHIDARFSGKIYISLKEA